MKDIMWMIVGPFIVVMLIGAVGSAVKDALFPNSAAEDKATSAEIVDHAMTNLASENTCDDYTFSRHPDECAAMAAQEKRELTTEFYRQNPPNHY